MKNKFGHGDGSMKPTSTGYTPEYLAKRVESVGGEGWTRTALSLKSMMPARGMYASYAWTNAHALLDRYMANGLRPIVLLGDTPSWMLQGNDLNESPRHYMTGPHKDHYVAFRTIMADLAEHFPYAVWELYNEADLSNPEGKGVWDYYGGRPGGAEEYADLFRVAQVGVRKGNRESIIIPSFACENYDNAPFEQGFVEEFCRASGAVGADGIPLHWYVAFESRWKMPTKVKYMYDLWMASGANPTAKIYCTEWGASLGSVVNRPRWLFERMTEIASSNLFAAATWFRWNSPPSHALYIEGQLDTGELIAFRTLAQVLHDAEPVQMLPSEWKAQIGTNLQRYYFRRGNERIVVAWRRDEKVGGGASNIVFPGTKLEIVNHLGNRYKVSDGGEWDSAGHLRQLVGTVVPEGIAVVVISTFVP